MVNPRRVFHYKLYFFGKLYWIQVARIEPSKIAAIVQSLNHIGNPIIALPIFFVMHSRCFDPAQAGTNSPFSMEPGQVSRATSDHDKHGIFDGFESLIIIIPLVLCLLRCRIIQCIARANFSKSNDYGACSQCTGYSYSVWSVTLLPKSVTVLP